jgi:hypothetical protein
MLVIVRVLTDSHHGEDQGGERDDDDGYEREPADDGDGAFGEGVLEPVAQMVAPREVTCRH